MGRRPVPMTADFVAIKDRGTAWVAERAGEVVGLVVVEPGEDHARSAGLREVRLYTNEATFENVDYSCRGYQEYQRGVQDGFHRVFFTT